MLYTFDILFRKELKDGGVKVVTYRKLLEEPGAFGEGEDLKGAVGELSLTDNEREKGYSISTLFVKYRAQLVGYYWAEVFGKQFPLKFSFNDPGDVCSIRAEIRDENDFLYSSDFRTFHVDGELNLDLSDTNSFVVFVPKDAPCNIYDGEVKERLEPGQLALVPAVCRSVSIHGDCDVKSIMSELPEI